MVARVSDLGARPAAVSGLADDAVAAAVISSPPSLPSTTDPVEALTPAVPVRRETASSPEASAPSFDPRLPVYETVEVRPEASGYVYLPPGVRDVDTDAVAIPDDALLSRILHTRDDLKSLATVSSPLDRGLAERLFAESLRLANEGRVTSARVAAREAWTENGSDPRVANHAADLAIRDLDWVEAEEWALRALILDASLTRAWTNLGIAFAHRGRVEDADVVHRRAVEGDPSDWRALAALAATQARGGHLGDAVGSYRNAILMAPQRSELRWNLALLLDRVGRTQEARAAFRAYLRLAPRSDGPRIARAQEWLADH
jgi:Flp pilus assembly protein TadD